ncbi:PEP-CTERM protein-sorting domain-containing protein [Terrimicrobium sacchariphilum]|uniref:PEP-CTERM protein-sorting domain-containing protein n=1 Tax=Terrimicrobium sacchariphilum TaxID=690879 RepID=A0A146GEY1_TERSA|nr:PEP-CTERM sorting domain-containing protein [Terrimicrobium sacchariphilum]GAT35224.1 PEP-CTERM protein-sorting domain-containing protein [Terrimicrobium sacchariphilum]
MKKSAPRHLVVCCAVSLLLGNISIQAASSTWTGAVNGNWTDSGNWSGGSVPGAGDTATFSGSSNTSVTVDSSRSIQNISFLGSDAGAFSLQSGSFVLGSGGSILLGANVANSQTIGSALALDTAATFSNESLRGGSVLSLGAVSGTSAVSLGGVGNGEINGAIAGTVTGITKSGSGTWTLRGGGSSAGQVTVANGNLVVDYSNAASGVNTNYAFASTASLMGSGGTMQFVAKTGAGNETVQTFASAGATANTGLSTWKSQLNGATDLRVTVGAFSRGAGTAVLFDSSSGGKFYTTTANQTAGYLNTATFFKSASGVDFAKAGSGTLKEISALGATTELTNGASSGNFVVTADSSITTTTRVNSLRVAGDVTITLTNTRIQSTAGFLFDSGTQLVTGSGTAAYLADANPSNAIIAKFGTGALTIDSAVKVGTGAGNVSFFGDGLIDVKSASNVTGTNQYFGTVRLSNTGAINFSNATGTGNGKGAVYLGSGGILEIGAATSLTRDVSSAGTLGTIQWTGDGGFSAFGGDRTVNLSSGSSLGWGSTAGFVGNGSALILGSNFSDSKLTFQNAIDLGSGNREVRVHNGVSSTNVDGELSGVLSGSGGSLTKTGLGALSVTGANIYSGGTYVSVGSLLVNNTTGSGTGTGAVYVQSGARLGGGGTMSGAVVVQGTLAPGNSIGTISTGSLTIASTGALSVELGRNAGTPVADRVAVTGAVTLDTGSNLQLTIYAGLTNPQVGDIFFLVDNDGADAVVGVFSKLNGVTTLLNEGSQFFWNSQAWEITYKADFSGGTFTGGNDVALLAVVPEPETWLLVTVAGLLMLVNGRRRRAP